MTNDFVAVQQAQRIERFSPAWWDAYREGSTPRDIEYALAYARGRLSRGGHAWCDEPPDALVASALADIATGTVAWAPETVALSHALCHRIRDVLKQHKDRAARTVRLDYLGPKERDGDVLEQRLTVAPDPAVGIDLHRKMPAVIAALQAVALDDVLVSAYLRARLDGVDGQAKIARAIGVTVAEVRAAHKRLVRLTKQIKPDVLELVRALLA